MENSKTVKLKELYEERAALIERLHGNPIDSVANSRYQVIQRQIAELGDDETVPCDNVQQLNG